MQPDAEATTSVVDDVVILGIVPGVIELVGKADLTPLGPPGYREVLVLEGGLRLPIEERALEAVTGGHLDVDVVVPALLTEARLVINDAITSPELEVG